MAQAGVNGERGGRFDVNQGGTAGFPVPMEGWKSGVFLFVRRKRTSNTISNRTCPGEFTASNYAAVNCSSKGAWERRDGDLAV